jgi:ABC-type dipeptide/oligopeptide/nickel transport system permease subunit
MQGTEVRGQGSGIRDQAPGESRDTGIERLETFRSRNRFADFGRRLVRNPQALIGLVICLVYVFLGTVGPLLTSHDYESQDLMATYLRPLHDEHILGTDDLGRDMYARLATGIRISLLVGFGVTAIAMVIGMFFGVLAGYFRGWVDTVVSGFVEFTWSFPLILIAVVLTGAFGPGLKATVLAIGLLNWAGFARVIRGEVLALREREFVQAAQASGASNGRILLRHIVPNIVAPTLVMASYYVALAIIAEAGLSFIGMGAQPPLPSLGVMVAGGRNFMLFDHWISTIPGVAIVLIVLGLNFLGDGLRDILDPRLRR